MEGKTLADLDLSALTDELADAPGTRSPLVVWMIEHHDELGTLFTTRGVNWSRLCEYLGRQGMTNGRGEKLTPNTVRHSWLRARAAVARQRAANRPPLPAPVTAPALASSPEPKFRPAKMRNDGRGVSVEERRALGDPTVPADRNEHR